MESPSTPPGAAEVRAKMGIPSDPPRGRGQKDTLGFASTAAQMARVWEVSAAAPSPERWPKPAGPVLGVLCPHDDYMLAGRVYRSTIPLVTARTVVLVGVFHGYRRFGARDALVFDSYPRWRSPDGDVPVSPLREAWLERMGPGDAFQDSTMHDSEHSVEAILYWLRHRNPRLEFVPVLVPVMSFDRLHSLAESAGAALAALAFERGLALGSDLAIVISADAVHYGADFSHVTFGLGGADVHAKASARDLELLERKIAGQVTLEKVRDLYGTFVNPADPDEYRLTWCGRFSIPFGMLLLNSAARAASANSAVDERPAADVSAPARGELARPAVVAHPVAYSTSIMQPPLPLVDVGFGLTAPANLEHFVGHAAAAFTLEDVQPTVRRTATASNSRDLDETGAPSPPGRVLSNGVYTVVVTSAGTGVSLAGEKALSAWSADRVEDGEGWFFYLRDAENGAVWSAGKRPVPAPPERSGARSELGLFVIEREDGGIACRLEICVAADRNTEIRRLTLSNRSARPRTIEIVSVLEVALDSLPAYRAHPVFSKMFVETEVVEGRGTLLARRRPRAAGQAAPWVAQRAAGGRFEYETDRDAFIGRGRDRAAPRALSGAPFTAASGTVLEPAFCFRTRASMAPGEEAVRSFVLGTAGSREKALETVQFGEDEIDAAFSEARTHAGAVMEEHGLSAAEWESYQALAVALLYGDPRLRAAPFVLERARGVAAELERLELSAGRAFALLLPGANGDAARALRRAHRLWRALGLPIDLVVVRDEPPEASEGEPASGVEAADRGAAAADAHAGAPPAAAIPIVLRASELGERALDALAAAARLVVSGALPDLSGATNPGSAEQVGGAP